MPGESSAVIDSRHSLSQRSAPPQPEQLLADERILVVDDERDITALVAYHLNKIGRASCRERV